MGMSNDVYFKEVMTLKSDINTYEIKLRDYKLERDSLIKKSGPASVRAICYEVPRVQGGGSGETEEWILNRIGELTGYITTCENIIAKKKSSLNKLKYQGKKSASKLNDIQRTVFILAYIEGKTNKEIAIEIDYSVHTVENFKTDIKKIITINQ